MRHLAKVFECKWKALELPLAVSVAASLVALYFVFSASGARSGGPRGGGALLTALAFTPGAGA